MLSQTFHRKIAATEIFNWREGECFSAAIYEEKKKVDTFELRDWSAVENVKAHIWI